MAKTETKTAEAEERKFLRDVSFWDVEQIQAMDLAVLWDVDAKIPDEEAHFQGLALLWLLHQETDQDEVERLVKADEWRDAVNQFKRNPAALWAAPEVGPAIEKAKELLSRFGFLDNLVAAADAEEGQD